MEDYQKASIEDTRCRGLIQGDSAFAPHSPGQCSTLAAPAKAMPSAFCRHLPWVEYAGRHRARYRKKQLLDDCCQFWCTSTSDEQALPYAVDKITDVTQMLLEVVNYVFIQRKYVCAGDVSVLSFISFHIY